MFPVARSESWIPVVLVIGLSAGLSGDMRAQSRPAPGAVFLRNPGTGRSEALGTYFKRGPVILNFWATYCEPCRREMPELEKFAQRHDVILVFISVDPLRDEEKVKNFVIRHEIRATVLHDPYQAAVELYTPGLEIPATFLIREGRIRFQKTGDYPGLLSELEHALGQP